MRLELMMDVNRLWNEEEERGPGTELIIGWVQLGLHLLIHYKFCDEKPTFIRSFHSSVFL